MLFKLVLLFGVFFLCGIGYVYAAANSPVIQQRDASNGSTVNRIIEPVPVVDSAFTYDATTNRPKLIPLSTISAPGATGATGPAGADGINATTTSTATTSENGLMSSGDKTKLNGIATGATANDTDANLRARTSHTGVQEISTVSGLQTAIDGKEASGAAAAAQSYSIQRGNHTGTQHVSTITGNGYNGTTNKNGVFPIIKTANVSGGTVAFHLTSDGLSTGTALCGEVLTNGVQFMVNDATASYQIGWSWSNLNKTVTATINKLTTANILTGLLGQASAPNGTPINMFVPCAN